MHAGELFCLAWLVLLCGYGIPEINQDHALGLLSELLHFGDAISMGNSVESRLPFLDHRLVEFVFSRRVTNYAIC
jgi:hypothetical protein